MFLICVASTFFWAGFEQAGSSLNLFGRDYTDRFIGSFEIPPAWFQSANSFFIVLLSPFFAALWINLTKRMLNPSYGLKCAVGLIIMASGFIVMFFAAQVAASGLQAAPYWLIATYFLHTVGELCLSPVALSAVSKLSPKRFAGQMMGIFTLTYSIGSVVAGWSREILTQKITNKCRICTCRSRCFLSRQDSLLRFAPLHKTLGVRFR